VVLAAAIEAILGLAQFFSVAENVVITGTYTVRNHFAGLMELALPFPARYTLAAFGQSPARGYIDQATVIRVAAGAALTVLLAVGALFSLSRGAEMQNR
jgi:hypothetical protein